ncbi:hypothetical protein BH20GEM3_BH20GEM3_02170 [soil metagenome]
MLRAPARAASSSKGERWHNKEADGAQVSVGAAAVVPVADPVRADRVDVVPEDQEDVTAAVADVVVTVVAAAVMSGNPILKKTWCTSTVSPMW